MDLVKIIENQNVVTDSLTVAKFFEKKHSVVVRKIKELISKGSVTENDFVLSNYKDNSGRILPYYTINKDGFVLLVMGFTGEKAHLFKIEYIKAFNTAFQLIQDQQDQLSYQQALLLDKAKTENRMFKLDYVLETFGEISEITGLPRTKPIAYLRSEKEQKVRLFCDELGLYKEHKILFQKKLTKSKKKLNIKQRREQKCNPTT